MAPKRRISLEDKKEKFCCIKGRKLQRQVTAERVHRGDTYRGLTQPKKRQVFFFGGHVLRQVL